MSVPVTITGQIYNYPSPGDAPGWGEDASEAFVALVDKVNGISPSGDIVSGEANLNNNVVIPTAITTLSFDSSLIAAAVIEYSIRRTATAFNKTEAGRITISYSGAIWYAQKTIEAGEDAGITISIDNSGNVLYVSTNLAGTHVCDMKFRTRTFEA